MTYETLKVTTEKNVCRIVFDRPEAGNALNDKLIAECAEVVARCSAEDSPVTVVILEGGPEVFCAGGDFEAVSDSGSAGDPAPLYDLWQALADGPFVTVSLVRGRVNAGGVGFLAASDIVIAKESARISLSELLFGLYPACVLPFLIRRIGRQRAHYMTLMTRPLSATEARDAGLVNVIAEDTERAFRQHLSRLALLKKPAIARYKAYLSGCRGEPAGDREAALAANREMFRDPEVLAGIRRYVTELKLPWED
ncbi:enoyl-CoA hydratase/isomerase [Rhodobium gokarnense]|uniref:Polyketide biosynthesis enoyl-CoA hydratase PksH n=1 Tax=Rhodobium gokarnense TaxID=364296 RepID=A0ABT3H848_9HYPH|nr:enoyl-CoA hydratase/isomerase [Rhodobium gokarnense]MCW2306570.1 polyketide biosynthesis enoyl-CoA hydratase PksH [Rhodobium gokarnense]